MRPAKLSLLLPALDEEDGVEQAIRAALASLEELSDIGAVEAFEIVVIDDGSTDRTAQLVQDAADADPRVRLVQHDRNRGVGAAFRTGVDSATGDTLLYTDADMPVDLLELVRALPLLRNDTVGIVAGQRARYGADGWIRTLACRCYDRFAQVALGVRSRDVNFPFKLMSVDVARRLDSTSDGALIDAELLARARRLGLEVELLEMEYSPRQFGESKTMTVRLLRQLGIEVVRNRSTILRS